MKKQVKEEGNFKVDCHGFNKKIVANARALYSHFKFAFITTETMKRLLNARGECMDGLIKVIHSPNKFNYIAALSSTGINVNRLCTLEDPIRVSVSLIDYIYTYVCF